MFPKAWQAMAFVGAILIFVVFVFGEEGQPAGVDSAVEAAERSAANRVAEDAEPRRAPATAPVAEATSATVPGWNDAPPVGFAGYEIEEYGAPQASAAPVPAAPRQSWNAPGEAREPRQDEALPKGPPPPGTRDASRAPPRVIPQAPSEDPRLKRDLQAALERASN